MEKQATTRQLKVAREIQKDLAEIIRGKGMAFFGGAMVTVSEVRISPIRADTSSAGRFQFSVEKVYSVRYLTPSLTHSDVMQCTASTPA